MLSTLQVTDWQTEIICDDDLVEKFCVHSKVQMSSNTYRLIPNLYAKLSIFDKLLFTILDYVSPRPNKRIFFSVACVSDSWLLLFRPDLE